MSEPVKVYERFERVGVYYCVVHEGIANEDAPMCDFSRDEQTPCSFRPCFAHLDEVVQP